MPRKFKTLDLFSGIGGFAYALKSISKVVAYCDKSSDCRRVLETNMNKNSIPRAKIFEDVQTLNATDLPKDIVMITAGFPCQDISAANPHGKGLKGERSGLVKHVFRLMDSIPTVNYVILENSPRIKTRGLKELMKMFKSRNFTCKWTIMGCDHVGAPMLRQRWFCIATRNGVSDVPFVSNPIPITIHDWSSEPVPRLIPKDASYPVNLHRLQMLGNAVVPQCLQHAINVITFGPNYTAPIPKHPGTEIVLRQGKIVYRKQWWASPSTEWHQYNTLTYRSRGLLSNQIFYDDSTKAQVLTTCVKDNLHRLSNVYSINPPWVEWLMGYLTEHTMH